KLRNPCDDIAGVIAVAALSAVPRVPKQRLTSRAIVEADQIRLLRGVLQRNNKPFHLAALCRLGSGADLGPSQTGQGSLVSRHIRALPGGSEEFGTEGIGEACQFFIELLQFGFVGLAEFGSGVYKLVIGVLEQAQRFRIKLERVTLVVDGLYALEQACVEVDCVPMRRELRRLE